MKDRLVYIVENELGERRNSSTGTKLYERLINACNFAGKYGGSKDRHVIEYKLVPTGNKYNHKGELIGEDTNEV